jgi:hypothetical protein
VKKGGSAKESGPPQDHHFHVAPGSGRRLTNADPPCFGFRAHHWTPRRRDAHNRLNDSAISPRSRGRWQRTRLHLCAVDVAGADVIRDLNSGGSRLTRSLPHWRKMVTREKVPSVSYLPIQVPRDSKTVARPHNSLKSLRLGAILMAAKLRVTYTLPESTGPRTRYLLSARRSGN